MTQACPPCKLELRVKRVEDAAATQREKVRQHGDRLDNVERHNEHSAVLIDRLVSRLSTVTRELELLAARQETQTARQELAMARIEGALDMLSDRPSVVVQAPEGRRTPSSSLELGNGRWTLRARGLLPALLVVLLLGVALAVWALGR